MGFIRDFIKSAIKQIFAKSEEELPREGRVVLSKKAIQRMAEWHMSEEGIKLTYEYGTKTEKETGLYLISRKYEKYSENLLLVEEWKPKRGTADVEKVVFIITCWKGSVKI